MILSERFAQNKYEGEEMYVETDHVTDEIEETGGRTGLEIAVIGMAGRFPGARNIHQFWRNLEEGKESITYFTTEELKENGIPGEELENPDYIKARGTIEEIEYFDAAFFGYTPVEAEVMDPQVRLAHESVWEALEDAGYNPDTYNGRIGLYAGASPNLPWEAAAYFMGHVGEEVNFSKEQLFNKDYLCLRISYHLNLKGPAVALNTTCSTSLVAVDIACKSLLTGQCGMAVAGGVTVSLPTKRGYIYREGMVMSLDGHIRAFDANARGTNGGDGVGFVVLKQLEEAELDRDNIYAVIKGSAINNDGSRKVGFTAPSVEGQAEVIRAAQHMAEVAPESVGYIEAHGTGTPMGDPVEIEALKQAFDTEKKGFCKIGSVKTNVGHLDSAAGVAAFIKTVLALKNRALPKSLHFETPNPQINFSDSPFDVNTGFTEWKSNNGYPLRAGVSAFGIGGTNAHVILEEAPPLIDDDTAAQNRQHHLILLSAKTEDALEKMTRNLEAHLRAHPEQNLADVAYTLQVGRKAFKHRRMTISPGINETVEQLGAPGSGKIHSYEAPQKKPPVLFMFSGQGNQYVNMGLDLYRQEHFFREEMDRCFDIVKTREGWDPKEILYPAAGKEEEARRKLYRQAAAQPVIFIFEYCLARLLIRWGIEPTAMIGYSIGEYVAACLAGVFNLEDVLPLAVYRGRLMDRLPTGAMMSVPMTETELAPLLGENIEIAVVNGPSCIVAGTHEAVESFEKEMRKKRCICMRLDISHAGHSRMMAPMLEELEARVQIVPMNKPEIPYISNVSGTWVTEEQATDPAYWAGQVRAAVRFYDGLTELLKVENGIFMELGPGRNLLATLMQHNQRKPEHKALNMVRLPQQEVCDQYYYYEKIGRLWLYGGHIDWEEYNREEKRYRQSLPTYPFERQSYGVDISVIERLKEGRPPETMPVPTLPNTVSTEKKKDIADWFYVPNWKSAPISRNRKRTKTVQDTTRWLLQIDPLGFGAQVAERLKQNNREVITVSIGKQFNRFGTGNYTMDPSNEDHYKKLFDALEENGRIPERIVHCWNISIKGKNGEPETQSEWLEKCRQSGFNSLLFQSRTLGARMQSTGSDSAYRVRQYVVSNNMQSVIPGEIQYPEKVTLLGVVKAVPREYPELDIHSIDFSVTEPEKKGWERQVSQLMAELTAEPEEIEIAYRGRIRQVKKYDPLRLETHQNSTSVEEFNAKENGVYLITGGLGGIGLVLAEHLARKVRAKLILTGRTPIPPRTEWEAAQQNPGTPEKLRNVIAKLMEIDALDAQVEIYSANVADKVQMKNVIEDAVRKLGPIDGIIHAAGIAGGALLHRLENKLIEEVWTPKVNGTIVLNEILKETQKEKKPDFVVLCSSVGAVMGGMGEAAYTAANLFMDAYALCKSEEDDANIISIAWDAWKEVGGAVEVVKRLSMAGSVESELPGTGELEDQTAQILEHPILQRRFTVGKESERGNEIVRYIYVGILRPGNHWVLDEHRIEGTATLPGTAYLEMAGEAHRYTTGHRYGTLELRDVYIYIPLEVRDDEEKEVRTVLTKNNDGFDFIIVSRKNNGTQWLKHAEGKTWTAEGTINRELRTEAETKISIEDIEAACPQEITDDRKQQEQDSEARVVFGPRWRTTAWNRRRGDGQAITRLELAPEYETDTSVYRLHPALLDWALGVPTEEDGPYLPFSYKRIEIKGPMPSTIYSHIKYEAPNLGTPTEKKTLRYDAIITDETGIPVLEIEEYVLLHVGTTGKTVKIDATETDSRQSDLLAHGIQSSEGVEVFNRILDYAIPVIAVSTRDLDAVTQQSGDACTAISGEVLEGVSTTTQRHPRPRLSTAYAPPENETEKIVAATWEKILGYDTIGRHDDFFELGGNSVKAVIITSALHKELDVRIPVSDIFGNPTISGQAIFINNLEKSKFTAIEPAQKKKYYKLSSAQKRQFILQNLEANSTAYNLPMAAMLEGELSREKLENAFKQLIARHESLRTGFEMKGEEAVQRIHDKVDFEIEYYDLSEGNLQNGFNTERIINRFTRPFVLSEAPLLRVGLVKETNRKHALLVDMHHIIADGTSHGVFLQEFSVFYAGNGELLPPLEIQYKDFSEWQSSPRQKEELRSQEKYWLNQFNSEIPVLNLPIDKTRPSIQEFGGENLFFTLDEKESTTLKQMAAHEETTIYVVLMALYTTFLAKITGQQDIVVGSPVAGRRHNQLQNIIGMFVNTLAIRNKPKSDSTFSTYLRDVKAQVLDALENQDYPFEELVEKLAVNRDPARNPLFDVMFTLQNMDSTPVEMDGLNIIPYEYQGNIAKFDLSMYAAEVEQRIEFSFQYATMIFESETIQRFIKYFCKLASEVSANPKLKIQDIDIIPESEKQQLLYGSNDTEKEYPRDKTIHKLFEDRATATPNAPALLSTKPDVSAITYREFNDAANSAALRLQAMGVTPGNIVALKLHRSPEMVIQIMGILKAGAAYLPIAPDTPQERIDYMLKDSGAKLLLTKHEIENLKKLETERPVLSPTKDIHSANSLSYIIYTSGSTGKPKGVMVEHNSVVNLLSSMQEAYSITENGTYLFKTAYIFDVSVTELFGWFMGGGRLAVLEAGGEKDPRQITAAIQHQSVTHINFVPSMFSAFLKHTETEPENIKKLKHLKYIFLAGETMPGPLVERFIALGCPSIRLENIYGPTEATVYATQYSMLQWDGQGSVPIGKPLNNITLYILNQAGNIQPLGIPGELHIGGAALARGYLNNPQLTAEKFLNITLENRQLKLYKTGDLARWKPDGNIEFLGRIDLQVKIRGFRIELEEIENLLLQHTSVKESVAAVLEDNTGDKYLCAYITVNNSSNPPGVVELKEYLAQTLPGYMIPSFILPLDELPLTAGGKVNRKALPTPQDANEPQQLTPPHTELEKSLAKLWADVLGIETESIGRESNFFQLGGHSLKAIGLIARTRKDLNLQLTLGKIFATPTLSQQAASLQGMTKETYKSIEKAETKAYYRLSPAQKRQYILQTLEPNSITYNLPMAATLEGTLNREKLENAFKQIIARHESLRTFFEMKGDETVQRIHMGVDFEIDYFDLTDGSVEENTTVADLIQHFPRSFVLSEAPLMRVGLIKKERDTHILVVDQHHIITDGTSHEIFLQELTAFYSGKGDQLPPLEIQYKDYSEWQNSIQQKAELQNQEQYWLNQFNDEIPVLNLPIDKPRPSIQEFDGRNLNFNLDEDETVALKQLAAHESTTLFTVLLTIFTTFLAKMTGQQDIIVGSATAGRRHNQLQSIIGMFVNTLAIRNKPKGDAPFTTYLRDVKTQVLDALENQDYPFEELVEKVPVNRDAARNPLFDVMFTLQNMSRNPVETDGLNITPYDIQGNITKFDLSLLAVEVDQRIELSFQYATSLFEPQTIQRFKKYFCKLASEVSVNPTLKIRDIDIIPESEKQQTLYDFNDTKKEYPRHKSIHRLFEDQAAATPDASALISTEPGTSVLSYSEFNDAANIAALQLQTLGVTPGNIVALKLHRSIEMVIQVMGILKAGCAYLPIAPDTPQERIDYMLKDSGAQRLLTEHEIENQRKQKIDISASAPMTETHSPNALSYIIYTSGSTGYPKGVMVEHAGVVNLLTFMQDAFPVNETSTYLFKASFTFDLSVLESFGWFKGGGRLAVLQAGDEQDPQKIMDAVQRHALTHIYFVPSMFSLFIEQTKTVPENREKLKSLEYIFLGGEALPGPLVKRFNALGNSSIRLENLYGPTEASVYVTTYSLAHWNGRGSIPIGKPINNTVLYILDQAGQIQPVGIPGELCIGGTGLTRGYLNNPALTADRFRIHNICNHSLPLYKTGDLVRRLPDGNIEFLGRIDHQVKIRGFRIELEEIENRLLQHTSVKESVTSVLEDNTGDKYLCAYITVNDRTNAPGEVELKEYLAQTLPGYMIPSFILPLYELPLTPGGKVNRKALPTPQDANEPRQLTPPQNELEKILAQQWADVLGTNKKFIGRESDFFQLGGHSLKAVALIARIRRELNVSLTLSKVFTTSTLSQQAASIRGMTKETYRAIEKAEQKEYYRLSHAQKRQYILQTLAPGSTAYNLPMAAVLEGTLNRDKLENAFKQIIARHESLRTSFEMEGDEAVQLIHREVDFEIDYFDLTDGSAEENTTVADIIQRFPRSFVLSEAPLMRVGLIKEEQAKHILVVDQHHIITDGTSHEIFLQELTAFYEGKGNQLPPLEIQYKDYSEWQNREDQKAELQNQEQYWLNQFNNEIPVLNLPIDKPRPSFQEFEGRDTNFSLDEKDTAALKQLAAHEGTTLFTVLLTLYTTLLTKITGQQDIVVGTPVAGRKHNQLQSIIGMFVNTLAIRNKPKGDTLFTTYLRNVKTQVMNALENQDYPFEELVEKVTVNRDAARNPLFDVMFTLQNMERTEVNVDGLSIIPYEYRGNKSKFDLSLFAMEINEQIKLSLHYPTSLFKPETIQRFKEYFQKLVVEVSANPMLKIRGIDIIPESEKQQILYDFNDTAADYPEDKTLHECFKEQVVRTPHHIALVGKSLAADHSDNVTLSYLELDKRTDYLGARLMINGIEPGDIVGIDVARSVEMIYAMLAIVKAGAAYLPISKDFPEARKRFMLVDSRASLLVTDQKTTRLNEAKSVLNNTIHETPQLNIIDEAIYRETAKVTLHLPTLPITTADPVYVIYTSGSSGRPKGVVVEHRNVVNVVSWFARKYRIGAPSHVLQMSEITFDPSVNQVFGTILYGGVLFTVDKDLLFNIEVLRRYIDRHQIHLLNFVPQMLEKLLCSKGASRLLSVKNVLSGGEKLDEIIKNNILRKGYKLFNQYGPTETTIDACAAECSDVDPKVTLGPPISNTRCYILDKYDTLVPIGSTGEMCIGGKGLSRGYLNNPQLTSEKFVTIVIEKLKYKLYKTGDLARWQPDGTIEFLGRKDNQVKIRGYRIEPEEIETRILGFKAVKEAVVEAKEKTDGEKFLCAYIVLENQNGENNEKKNESAITGLKQYLSSRLPEYMLPATYVIQEKLPLTPNGKINRKALPDPQLTGTKTYKPPYNRLQKELAKLWADVLGIEKDSIGLESNFFQLGGHSLKAVILLPKLHKFLGVEISLAELFEYPTLRELGEFIRGKDKSGWISIKPSEEKEYYTTSSAQKRLFLLQEFDKKSTGYNMPHFVTLEGCLDRRKLEDAFKFLVKRHSSFRTSFRLLKGEPVQRIHNEVTLEIENYILDISTTVKEVINDFVRPFDLTRAPLLRVGLITVEEEKSLLMMDMHHTISDGLSHNIIIKDLATLYTGRPLMGLNLQYKDYTEWKSTRSLTDKYTEEKSYWLKCFENRPPILNLPYSTNETDDDNAEGNTVAVELDCECAQALRQMARDENTTLFAIMFAAINVLMARLTQQEDIVVGTPAAGRNHTDIEPLVGMFVNTLALRNYPAEQKKFKDFLQEVKQSVLKAFQYQQFPLEELADLVAKDRNINENPLFNVMFTFVNQDIPTLEVEGITILPYLRETEGHHVKFDLNYIVSDHGSNGETLTIMCEYRASRFTEEDIEGFLDYYKVILQTVTKDAHMILKDIPLLHDLLLVEPQTMEKDFNF
jgi:amino acid adenylation domain-containing protein